MSPLKKRTAIKASVSLTLLLIATAVSAAPVGSVTDLDGTLLVSRGDGSVKVLALGSEIEQGDTLASRKKTYVTMTMVDNSIVTLGPNTDIKIERYVYFKHTPDNDGALIAFAKGSVRITAGVLGTRSGDTFTLATPTATVDMRGASLIAEYVAPEEATVASHYTVPRDSQVANRVAVSYAPAVDPRFIRVATRSNELRVAQFAPPSTPPASGLRPGLYVQVLDGLISLSNAGGAQNFAAGQFGYTPAVQSPPVIVPANPGIKFTPPPAFSMPSGSVGPSSIPKSAAVDCEVR